MSTEAFAPPWSHGGPPLPVLHAAALPFPTPQGTQAAVHAMAEAHAATRATALVTYAGGVGDRPSSYSLLRAGDVPGSGNHRSGPSLRKVAEDVRLAATLRRSLTNVPRATVFAHHVEATACALLASPHPVVMVAHTDLGAELPTYLGRAWRLHRPTRVLGTRTDRVLARSTHAVAAVAPALAQRLAQHTGCDVAYLPIPWSPAASTCQRERSTVRASMGLRDDVPVVLYAGNLDAYQGWEDIVVALRLFLERAPQLRMQFATASDPAPLWSFARALGVADRIALSELGDEQARRRAHAAADVVVVPRRTPGGLPIKLLDAIARGVPVVVTRRAAAGLPIENAAVVVSDDDASALAAGIETVLRFPAAAQRNAELARRYLELGHSPTAYLAAAARVEAQAWRAYGARGARRRFW